MNQQDILNAFWQGYTNTAVLKFFAFVLLAVVAITLLKALVRRFENYLSKKSRVKARMSTLHLGLLFILFTSLAILLGFVL
jgi:hypothetical protein